MAKVRTHQRFSRERGKESYGKERTGRKEKGRVRKGRKPEALPRLVKLAVSLDMIDLERAISIAADVAAHADLFCLGSALVKSEGMRAIRAISTGFPEMEIFVDLRASAGSREEATMAFEAGADLVSVSLVASEKSCREAVGVAKTFGARAVLDLYGLEDPEFATRKGLDLGFDYLYFRTDEGISRSYELYRKVSEAAELPLIVDGAVEFREFARVSRLLPAVVVVGSAITESSDPAASAERFGELVHRRRAA